MPVSILMPWRRLLPSGDINKYLFLLIFLSFLLWLPATALAQAAKVVDVRGTSLVERAGAAPRILGAGEPLDARDTISVARDSWAILEFSDQTRVTLRPNTVFRLDSYKADAPEAMLLGLVKGGLRVVTGLFGKRNPQGVRVQTAVATIGIRGTEFDARLCEADCAQEERLHPALRPQTVARVVEMKGVVAAARAGEVGRVLVPGAALYEGDGIATGPGGYAALVFRDGSRISVTADSLLTIRAFRFDETRRTGYAVFDHLGGGAAVQTGAIAKQGPRFYRFISPMGEIRPRGTGFFSQARGAAQSAGDTGQAAKDEAERRAAEEAAKAADEAARRAAAARAEAERAAAAAAAEAARLAAEAERLAAEAAAAARQFVQDTTNVLGAPKPGSALKGPTPAISIDLAALADSEAARAAAAAAEAARAAAAAEEAARAAAAAAAAEAERLAAAAVAAAERAATLAAEEARRQEASAQLEKRRAQQAARAAQQRAEQEAAAASNLAQAAGNATASAAASALRAATDPILQGMTELMTLMRSAPPQTESAAQQMLDQFLALSAQMDAVINRASSLLEGVVQSDAYWEQMAMLQLQQIAIWSSYTQVMANAWTAGPAHVVIGNSQTLRVYGLIKSSPEMIRGMERIGVTLAELTSIMDIPSVIGGFERSLRIEYEIGAHLAAQGSAAAKAFFAEAQALATAAQQRAEQDAARIVTDAARRAAEAKTAAESKLTEAAIKLGEAAIRGSTFRSYDISGGQIAVNGPPDTVMPPGALQTVPGEPMVVRDGDRVITTWVETVVSGRPFTAHGGVATGGTVTRTQVEGPDGMTTTLVFNVSFLDPSILGGTGIPAVGGPLISLGKDKPGIVEVTQRAPDGKVTVSYPGNADNKPASVAVTDGEVEIIGRGRVRAGEMLVSTGSPVRVPGLGTVPPIKAADNVFGSTDKAVEEGLYVWVRDGAVRVTKDADSVDVAAGNAAVATKDGVRLLDVVPNFLRFDGTPRPLPGGSGSVFDTFRTGDGSILNMCSIR